ncbi:helix-turn-helix domain-containing protein [Winslowiella iniecta]
MNIKQTNIQKIQELLARRGIDKRKQSSTIAEVLGIKYNSAKQKIDGKRSITLVEIKKIYRYFNESFDGGREYNCVFIMNDMHVRCNVEIETEIAEFIEQGVNYAINYNDNYIINTNIKINSENAYRVRKLDFLPAPKIAILDNDAELLELLKSVSARFGIDAQTFQNRDEILEAIKKQPFDCFIIDWLLDYGMNSEKVINAIRDINEACTIILLTGQLNRHEREIGETIMKYGVDVIEKPTRTFIISSILLNNLFFKD